MTPITKDQRRAVVEAAEKATPGRRFWALDKHSQFTNLMTGNGKYVLSPQEDTSCYGLRTDCWIDATKADALFIELATPDAFIALESALAAAEAERDALRVAARALLKSIDQGDPEQLHCSTVAYSDLQALSQEKEG